jgi:branched-chain amino acid transport system ATP-binding protein
MTDFLKTENLCKSFGKLIALDNVSFSLKQGEIVGLVGPNGAGKTTCLNGVSGYFPIDSGKVIFKGIDVSRLSTNKLAVMGMVRTFQIPKPFKRLTVYENVAISTLFNPRFKHLNISVGEFVEGILKEVGLDSLKNTLAVNLNYPNVKRLEVARSQGLSPELLLLDEAFSGLNANEIESESQLLKRLAQQGMTMLIVEHKVRELAKLVNRIIVLHYGKLIADGSPEDVLGNEEVLRVYLGRRWKRDYAA